MNAEQLLAEYNKALKQLGTIYNNNVANILKQNVKNAIKQYYFNNLTISNNSILALDGDPDSPDPFKGVKINATNLLI